ncbi:hypothetical protein [Nostoc sp.]|uniref:hypothetical protein n=1 Tax=Nostoc sp. TaxID=1180 RepID=UPI002FF958CE
MPLKQCVVHTDESNKSQQIVVGERDQMNWHSDAVMLLKCNIYLIIKNTAFSSAFQAIWDEHSLVCFIEWYLTWGAKRKMASKLILQTARVSRY